MTRDVRIEWLAMGALAHRQGDGVLSCSAGVSDMAKAIVEGRKPRVSAELCRHVTEGINAFDVCVATGKPYKMTTTFEMPAALKF